MDKKDLFLEAHRWELLLILEYLTNDGFFEYLVDVRKIHEIVKHFKYEKDKIIPTINLLKKLRLIHENKNGLYSTDFSKIYLNKSSNKFIGNYLSWKVNDIANWKNNIGKVLKGELESIYTDEPLKDDKEENGAPLSEIISVCGFLYPSTEFVNILNKKKIKGTLMDLGCGTGEWSFLIAKNNKNIDLIEVDFNPQNSKKRMEIIYPELISRTKFIKGDFLKDKLPKADTVLVSNNFMEYSDSQIKKLIKKLINKSETKTLLIHEYILDNDDFPYQYNVYCSLVTKNGRLRTKEEWKVLLSNFREITFKKLDFGSYAIIATNTKI